MAVSGSWAASRRLLQRVRNLMAAPESAQARLDRVTQMIAGEMVAEVCSVYILRAGSVLELFATEGLQQSAVHQTRLQVGEGLVGDIAARARPLRLSEAQNHPQFAFRPETGEAPFHSLIGVPILRSGRVTGVLVVQNRSPRTYTDEELETLETIAMVLAELIAAGELIDPREQQVVDGLDTRPARIAGVALSGGLAVGTAWMHRRRPDVEKLVAEDREAELARLEEAVDSLRRSIDALMERLEVATAVGEHTEVMAAYRLFAHDRGWLRRITEAINTGLTAEAAVRRVSDDTRARMTQITDPYLRERMLDLDELNSRLLLHLSGQQVTVDDLPDNAIIVARDISPAELLDFVSEKLAGVVLEEGSPTGHAAIVARALDIPMVGRARGVLAQSDSGDAIVVDGNTAQVLLRPSEDVLSVVEESLATLDRQRAQYEAERNQPAVTVDGEKIGLFLNAGLLADMAHLDRTGADGVGLYRTEIAFMVRSSFPNLEEQQAIYRRVIESAGGRPITFRTLDVGGDKSLPYFRAGSSGDENPAMGWRAIRVSLDRPAILRTQLRAMLMAADGGPLSLMFPMVTDVAELVQARGILDREVERLAATGGAVPAPLRVGVMLEVPSLIFQLDTILAYVDFISVGTNDLMQFIFAADRSSSTVANRYDVLAPPALRMIANIAAACRRAGVPLAICGEMAGHPLEVMACIALGVRNFSMSPSSVGAVRTLVRSLDTHALTPYLAHLLDSANASLRNHLRSFALDHGVRI